MDFAFDIDEYLNFSSDVEDVGTVEPPPNPSVAHPTRKGQFCFQHVLFTKTCTIDLLDGPTVRVIERARLPAHPDAGPDQSPPSSPESVIAPLPSFGPNLGISPSELTMPSSRSKRRTSKRSSTRSTVQPLASVPASSSSHFAAPPPSFNVEPSSHTSPPMSPFSTSAQPMSSRTTPPAHSTDGYALSIDANPILYPVGPPAFPVGSEIASSSVLESAVSPSDVVVPGSESIRRPDRPKRAHSVAFSDDSDREDMPLQKKENPEATLYPMQTNTTATDMVVECMLADCNEHFDLDTNAASSHLKQAHRGLFQVKDSGKWDINRQVRCRWRIMDDDGLVRECTEDLQLRNLARHIVTIHAITKPNFDCSTCKRSFARRDAMNRHYRVCNDPSSGKKMQGKKQGRGPQTTFAPYADNNSIRNDAGPSSSSGRHESDCEVSDGTDEDYVDGRD
ncbi:hypothetical protein A0H81_01815 [Grifola frondosa]|uniref:C2H2-type domain-containing protein n=1 Tax=Grifola frondosa TaxID=5627 RepID=A0A1C7MK53_GRIFR|nr:hypothetical protein A0H81_01815 [Grifola frondosa]